MTRDDLKRILEAAQVGVAAHGRNALTGGPVDRLPPHLWEALRVELQRRYRNATGEEFATLTVSPQDRVTGMSRELMGFIVDEVFEGAIEDSSVIEDIYRAIRRHEASPQLREEGSANG